MQTFNLIWMQGQTCDGNTMSIIDAENPDFLTFLEQNNINLLYHPTLSPIFGKEATDLFDKCMNGETPVHIFIFEGAVPTKTGYGDYFKLQDVRTMVKNFASKAMLTLACGSCASYGGIPNTPPNESGAVGLQWNHFEKGGLLGEDYISAIGMPVVNIPGCPTHPDWLMLTLQSFVMGRAIHLDKYNRPLDFFKERVHRGCNACEFNEKHLTANEFNEIGCLESNLGCSGKTVHGDCNIRLWHNTSSCTRSGHPCIGCTDPGFPGNMLPFLKEKSYLFADLKEEVETRNNILYGKEAIA